MAWDKKRSSDRIKAHLDGMGEIRIEKLKREADLWSLLSETECREIYGAHIYVDVANFSPLASRATSSIDDIKRLVQGVHVYQREAARIVENDDLFDGVRVHFQGARLHALFYRPIDDSERIAVKAVLLQLVLRDFVSNVFNPTFPKLGNFRTSAAADVGDTIGTQNGVLGDRELLFLGGPANRAAKAIGDSGEDRITEALYKALPDDLKAICASTSDTSIYEIGEVTQARLDELCVEHGLGWDRDRSRERIDDDKKQFPLSDISVESAEVQIDVDALSISKNKRIVAVSLFADLTGFTPYIERAEDADKRKEALRVLHAVRKEFTKVLSSDFKGVRIQYQGDRVQAIFHLPVGDDHGMSEEAVEAAAGIQSSMEITLKEHLPEAGELTVAIGLDKGLTLVSRLGTRGARDPICLGAAVQNAARIEEAVGGKEIGISTAVRDALPETQQDLFKWRLAAQAYVASSLTAEKLERAKNAAKMFASNGSAFIKTTAGVTTFSSDGGVGVRAVAASKPYAR